MRRGAFCRLYGNSVRTKSQGLSRNKFCTAVDKEIVLFSDNRYPNSMSTTVVAAGVTFAVVLVVVTFYIWIKPKCAAEQRFDCGITGAANTTVKLDTCLGECHLCTTADAAANKIVNAE